MLHIHTFTFNPFQENTYLIYNDEQECWIIDPGMSNTEEEAELIHFITKNKLKPIAIINTHAHIDHILGVDAIAKQYKIPFYLCEMELPILYNAANTARMFGFEYQGVQTKPELVKPNQILKLNQDEIHILFVPGHSPGSIALYAPQYNWVISGDALFNGSIGRTDLLLGDYNTLINSIKTELFKLPDNTALYSGHGPSSTIGHEKRHNPFLN